MTYLFKRYVFQTFQLSSFIEVELYVTQAPYNLRMAFESELLEASREVERNYRCIYIFVSKSKHLYTLQNNTYKLDLRNKAESNYRFVSGMRMRII